MAGKQLECRVVIRWRGYMFDLGMYDPVSGRYEPLGSHPRHKANQVIKPLVARMLWEGHRVSFSERRG